MLKKIGRALGRLAGTEPPCVVQDRADGRAMKRIMRAVLDETSCCIDAGAHEGSVLAWMCRFAPRGHHMAFEPLPHLSERLRKRFPRVDVHTVALSDTKGESTFQHVVTNPAYSGLRRRTYDRPDESVETITVQVARLDDLVPEDQSVHLIKIDVEGAELEVLRGGEQTLQRCRPHILFEHGRQGASHYGYGAREIWDMVVHRLGLSLMDLRSGTPYTESAFLEVCERGTHWNFLAAPASSPCVTSP